MAEDREGKGRGARSKDKAADRINVHRVNDFVLGHVGQIAYEPIAEDDDCVGTLRFSRLDEHREFKSLGFALGLVAHQDYSSFVSATCLI